MRQHMIIIACIFSLTLLAVTYLITNTVLAGMVTKQNSTITTTSKEGDQWNRIVTKQDVVEWRTIRNAQDTMAVVHIHQGDSLFTWVGKPCQCY